MKIIELMDLVSPCKTGKETEGDSSQIPKPNGIKRREISNSSIFSLDIAVRKDSELD